MPLIFRLTDRILRGSSLTKGLLFVGGLHFLGVLLFLGGLCFLAGLRSSFTRVYTRRSIGFD